MANPEHVAKLKEGVEAWNAWRDGNPEQVPNLSDANLNEAFLPHVNLERANANGADFWGATLKGADLRSANLCAANFTRATLVDANLDGAYVWGTVFADCDLSSTKGLDSLVHMSPSSIGVDTLCRSGPLPKAFLRGCGVPDSWISEIPALLGSSSPIKFYSCFICYSHKDEEFAKRLYKKLQETGLQVWYAREDLQRGKKMDPQIDKAIRDYDKLLLILSQHSMTSDWVGTEIYKARQREVREDRQVLFPIRLVEWKKVQEWEAFDADTGKDMAREIREYYVPDDFVDWKDDDAFESACEKLLRDLQKNEQSTP